MKVKGDESQIVWTQQFSILRDGVVMEVESICVWLIHKHRFLVVELDVKNTPYPEGDYTFSREELGADGL